VVHNSKANRRDGVTRQRTVPSSWLLWPPACCNCKTAWSTTCLLHLRTSLLHLLHLPAAPELHLWHFQAKQNASWQPTPVAISAGPTQVASF